MGKKKFIDKKNSQTYHVVHRSQTDEAYAGDSIPSEFVLVPAKENGNFIRKQRLPLQTAEQRFANPIDHITADGFKNDGYDYSQHLRELEPTEGGRFISKSGKTADFSVFPLLSSKNISADLPNDALPSIKELPRDLQAITISADLMDDDLRAALFEGFDSDGEFEELDDNFVEQIITEPTEKDFDFEAHIAYLIARSEERSGITKSINKPRGWDNTDAQIEEEDEMEDEFYEDGDDDEVSFNDRDAAGHEVSQEKLLKINEEFEKTFEEYGDEELGYLSEAGEEEIDGKIDVEGEDGVFQNAIDEFLQDQKDAILAEGLDVKKGSRNVILPKRILQEMETADESSSSSSSVVVDFKKSYAEQLSLQNEMAEYLKQQEELLPSEGGDFQGDAYLQQNDDLEKCQEYLRKEKIVDQWDCETIISSYSILDNHPTIIKDKNDKYRPHKSKYHKSVETSVSSHQGSNASILSNTYSTTSRTNQIHTAPIDPNLPKKIQSTGKLHLPQGFGPMTLKTKHIDSKSIQNNTNSITNRKLSKIVEVDGEVDPQKESNSIVSDLNKLSVQRREDEDDSGETESSVSEGNSELILDSQNGRRRKESKEEKKNRKMKVKEERKAKRSSKKMMKEAFRNENNKLVSHIGKEQTIDHVGVFKYS